jgi:hypothetical protein
MQEVTVNSVNELQRLNRTIATLHLLLAKQQAEAAEWKSKYLALLSHVKGPAVDDDTSPLGGE